MFERVDTINKLLFSTLLLAAIIFHATVPLVTASQKVYIKSDFGLTETESNIVLANDAIYVPVEFLKEHLEQAFIINLKAERVYWQFQQQVFTLETKELNNRIKHGLQLNFMLKNIGGTYYLNISNMSRLLGAEFIYDYSADTLTISRKSNLSDRKLNSIRTCSAPSNPKITLVWDQITKASPDLSLEEPLAGLNVISPTWFSLSSQEGDVRNNADFKYVIDAHKKGYKVWALVTNSFDKDLTHKLLININAQDNFINQMLVYSSLYNLDGINIDFENIYDTDKNIFTDFVKRLTIAAKQQNIVISLDLTVPSNSSYWSKCYDRSALGNIVDYIMLMAYDEYYANSPVSGSVATIGWTEAGLKGTLTMVPKEKLLLGIPFYTREWQETPGSRVKLKTMSMAAVKTLITKKHLTVNWLDKAGQNYIEYNENGKKYRIWLEDEHSLKLRTDLVHKYNLPGIAAWRKGFEFPHIWNNLASQLTEADTTVKPAAVVDIQ